MDFIVRQLSGADGSVFKKLQAGRVPGLQMVLPALREATPGMQATDIQSTIVALRSKGHSYAVVARTLNRHGIAAVRGGRWYAASVWRHERDACLSAVGVSGNSLR